MIKPGLRVIFKGPAPHINFNHLIGKEATLVQSNSLDGDITIQFDDCQVLYTENDKVEVADSKVISFPGRLR